MIKYDIETPVDLGKIMKVSEVPQEPKWSYYNETIGVITNENEVIQYFI